MCSMCDTYGAAVAAPFAPGSGSTLIHPGADRDTADALRLVLLAATRWAVEHSKSSESAPEIDQLLRAADHLRHLSPRRDGWPTRGRHLSYGPVDVVKEGRPVRSGRHVAASGANGRSPR